MWGAKGARRPEKNNNKKVSGYCRCRGFHLSVRPTQGTARASKSADRQRTIYGQGSGRKLWLAPRAARLQPPNTFKQAKAGAAQEKKRNLSKIIFVGARLCWLLAGASLAPRRRGRPTRLDRGRKKHRKMIGYWSTLTKPASLSLFHKVHVVGLFWAVAQPTVKKPLLSVTSAKRSAAGVGLSAVLFACASC
jgi:hypothetical protein